MSRFSQVHWKYQYSAFVGIWNLFCVSRCLYYIVLIRLDTIFIPFNNMGVPCVYYKFSGVHQNCFIYISQTFCKYSL